MIYKTSAVSFCVLVIVFNVNAFSPSKSYITLKADNAIKKQSLKYASSVIQKLDINSCQPYYSEIFKNLLDTYERDIRKCENTQKDQLLALSNEGETAREVTTKSLKEICATINECIAENENLNFFDCVDRSGDKNTRGVWKASKDSSEIAAHIREQTHVIEYQAERCNAEANRVYVAGTAKATDEMIACYANGGITTSSTQDTPTSAKIN